ncbi:hypothetical protein [Gluconobacter cerinus]|uniref:hypothetical protein n=1 Tax=Gluconobacter cerinus TaxID=38307 RepID=UPI001B8D4547|nr:hypothetical protein [Gluconobacter cerinus]MBS0983391.1 hypothetical protein [Gluconobacter cerinus]
MLPNYGQEPFMVSTRKRSAGEILSNLTNVNRNDFAPERDYTRLKDESVWRYDDGDKASFAPEPLIRKLNPDLESRKFLCIDFDFLNPSAKYLDMKYGDAFYELRHTVELHFQTFFDAMRISETGVYFALSLEPSSELSFMTRSIIIPQTKEAIKIFPEIFSYDAYDFINFCDEAEFQLNKNLRQIMKNMILCDQLDDAHMDLTTAQMLADKENLWTLARVYPDC